MKRILFISLLTMIILIVVILKYYNSNYEIVEEINGFNVSTTFFNERFYFEIDGKYNFDLYANRKFKKKVINSIEVYESDDYYCVYPKIKDMNTYPLCYEDKKSIHYSLVKDKEFKKFYSIPELKNTIIDEEENGFDFYNNLDENTYIALWKYNGFYLMNKDNITALNLFERDEYENILCARIKHYLLLPDYDDEHIFNAFILVNLKNGKTKTIKSKYDIDDDSYIVGTYKNSVYLFDNKNLNLYEINIKGNIELIGSESTGYTKIENKKFVKASKNEYKVDKITYFEDYLSNYKYTVKKNGVYKELNDNENIQTLIFESDNIKIIGKYNNKLYFISGETLYEFNPSEGVKKIFYYFELNFNQDDLIFIYNQ